MKRRAKIFIIGFALVFIVLLVAVFSQYAFVVAVVGDPFEDGKESSHNSLVIVRRVDSAQNLTGKIVVFWWTAEYMNMQRAVLGIDRVANPSPTQLGMAAETDEELRPRAQGGYVIYRANVTGEFVAKFELPFQG